MRIGIVAPASRIEPALAEETAAIARAICDAELYFHPQCFLASGHFAGDDDARADAFVELANDPAIDAVWIARGGYGSNRIAERVVAKLTDSARRKIYLGYSDAGFLLAGLYRAGFERIAHGPVVADLKRDGGRTAIERALRFLTGRAVAGDLEPAVAEGKPVAAFNLTILSHLIGTPLEPDLSDHILMVEDVAEHLYAIDRALFHVTAVPAIRRIAGLKLGRFSDIPENDPPFGESTEQIAKHWCAVSGIAWLGRADIGHDVDNKIVPFGTWRG